MDNSGCFFLLTFCVGAGYGVFMKLRHVKFDGDRNWVEFLGDYRGERFYHVSAWLGRPPAVTVKRVFRDYFPKECEDWVDGAVPQWSGGDEFVFVLYAHDRQKLVVIDPDKVKIRVRDFASGRGSDVKIRRYVRENYEKWF